MAARDVKNGYPGTGLLARSGDLVRILVTPITTQLSFLFPYLPSPWTFQVGFRAEGPKRVEEDFGAYHTIGIQDF